MTNKRHLQLFTELKGDPRVFPNQTAEIFEFIITHPYCTGLDVEEHMKRIGKHIPKRRYTPMVQALSERLTVQRAALRLAIHQVPREKSQVFCAWEYGAEKPRGPSGK